MHFKYYIYLQNNNNSLLSGSFCGFVVFANNILYHDLFRLDREKKIHASHIARIYEIQIDPEKI